MLFQIWRDGWQQRRLERMPGHSDRLGDSQYIYLYQALDPPMDPSWLVGSYFAAEAIDAPVERLSLALGLGLLALVVAVVAALLLGRRVSRPVGALAAAAGAIGSLDLDDLAPLRRSRLREIDQAAIAFNAMVRALRVFAVYVPRQLVHGLIRRGVAASLVSERREVTVLFTDIVGFTGRTEDLGAEETAAFLNHHFGLLTACIEAEDGMVDKFIGDALMALWNAIEEQPDHAARAARAARAIVAAVRRDNVGRDLAGAAARRPARRARGGRQHRQRGAHELHRGRRYREHRPAPRGARQGAAARGGGRDAPQRGRRGGAAARTCRCARSAATRCAAATSRSKLFALVVEAP